MMMMMMMMIMMVMIVMMMIFKRFSAIFTGLFLINLGFFSKLPVTLALT